MPNAIDGSYDTPEGRKVFVKRGPDEDADNFAERAMELMIRAGTAFICEHYPE